MNKTLFIVICCVTGGLYVLSLFAERWLRHIDRLPITTRVLTKTLGKCSWLKPWSSTDSRLAGHLLWYCRRLWSHSPVDLRHLPPQHRPLDDDDCLHCWHCNFSSFPVWRDREWLRDATTGYSGNSADNQWTLHQDHPDRKSLLRNAVIKIVIIVFAVLVAICFGATYAVCGGDSTANKGHSARTCNRITSVAAALEWTVAFILVFFFFTLVADLWPAGKSSPRYMRRLARWQEKHGEGDDFTGRGAFSEHPERWQDRYDHMRTDMWERNTGLQAAGRDSTASRTPMVGAGIASTTPNSESPSMTHNTALPAQTAPHDQYSQYDQAYPAAQAPISSQQYPNTEQYTPAQVPVNNQYIATTPAATTNTVPLDQSAAKYVYNPQETQQMAQTIPQAQTYEPPSYHQHGLEPPIAYPPPTAPLPKGAAPAATQGYAV